jgi:hypothetical protein
LSADPEAMTSPNFVRDYSPFITKNNQNKGGSSLPALKVRGFTSQLIIVIVLQDLKQEGGEQFDLS